MVRGTSAEYFVLHTNEDGFLFKALALFFPLKELKSQINF